MIIEMIKRPYETWVPVDDINREISKKFKIGEQYPVDIKLLRNPRFHRKVFSFFNYCFKYWQHKNGYLDDKTSFDLFRKDLVKSAGFFNEYWDIDGKLEIEAKSLSYGNMGQDEFERVFSAIIDVAIDKIFRGCDKETEERLRGFF